MHVQALTHHNTVFSQIFELVPRHEFESLARKHHQGRKLRKNDALVTVRQLGPRAARRPASSTTWAALTRAAHHWPGSTGNCPTVCMTHRSASFWPAARQLAPNIAFASKRSCIPSTIDRCQSAFHWAKFRTTKGAVKLHIELDLDGYLLPLSRSPAVVCAR